MTQRLRYTRADEDRLRRELQEAVTCPACTNGYATVQVTTGADGPCSTYVCWHGLEVKPPPGFTYPR